MTTALHTSAIDWPAPRSIDAERVIAGSPQTSTFVLFSDGATEVGLWRVSPGQFATAHTGYVELIHVLEGEGELVHDDGEVFPLRPGVVLVLEDGWCGRWVVRQTIIKSYTVTSS